MKARVEKAKCFHCERDYPKHAIDYHQEQCGIARKFPCELCGRHFASPKGMTVHQGLTHSAAERDTPYKCNVPGCEYGGASAQVLWQHMRRHNKGMPARARSRSRSRSRLPSRSPAPAAHHQNFDFHAPADPQPPIRNNPPIIVQISRPSGNQSGPGLPQKYLSNLRQPHQPNKSQMQAEGRQTSPSGPNDHDYCSSSFDEDHSSRATSRGRNLSGASRDGRNGSSGMEMEAGDGDSPPQRLDRENRNENEEMDEAENEPPMDSDNEQDEEHSPNDNFRGVDDMEEEDEGQNDQQEKEKKNEEPKNKKIDWVSMIPECPLPEVAQQIVEIGLRQKISCYGKLDTEDRAKLLHLNPERAINIMHQLDLYWDNIVKKIEDSYEAVQAIIEEYGIRPNSRIADMIKEYVQKHATNNYLFEDEEENGPSTSAAAASAHR